MLNKRPIPNPKRVQLATEALPLILITCQIVFIHLSEFDIVNSDVSTDSFSISLSLESRNRVQLLNVTGEKPLR